MHPAFKKLTICDINRLGRLSGHARGTVFKAIDRIVHISRTAVPSLKVLSNVMTKKKGLISQSASRRDPCRRSISRQILTSDVVGAITDIIPR